MQVFTREVVRERERDPPRGAKLDTDLCTPCGVGLRAKGLLTAPKPPSSKQARGVCQWLALPQSRSCG